MPRPDPAALLPASVLLGAAVLGSAWTGARGLHAQGQGPFEPLHFEHLSNRDGLSQVTVRALLQDRHGFLWIGTTDGLNRWDGDAFELFNHDPDDPQSLSSRLVSCLYEDRSGALWVGTNDGLNRLDPMSGRFERYDPRADGPISPERRNLRALAGDRAGHLWIGHEDGLDRLDPGLGTLEPYRHDPEDTASLSAGSVHALLSTREGLWIGSDGGLDLWDPVRRRLRRLQRGTVLALEAGTDGEIWLGTRQGLERYDPATGRSQRFRHDPVGTAAPSYDLVHAVKRGRSGDLWLGTGGGVGRFEIASERFTPLPFERGAEPLYRDVLAITEDRAGFLWFGTAVSGLYRHDPGRGRFAHFFHIAGDNRTISHNVVFALHEDRAGELWVGTRGGGLDRFDAATGTFVHHRHDPEDPTSLAGDALRCLHEDRQGNLWIGTDGHGLDRLNPERTRFDHFRHDPEDPRSLSSDVVFAILENRAGNLWVGTQKGLDRHEPSHGGFVRYQRIFDDPHSPEIGPVADITEDRHGLLWIGTNAGLVRLDPGDVSFTRFRHDPPRAPSPSYDLVWSILESRSGDLWIGTGGGGLLRFDPSLEIFTERYLAADGLGSNVVNSMLEDSQARLWISTNRGLLRFDPAAKSWTRYDAGDGLQDVEFNLGASHRGADGTMYFGGIRGFNAFRPESFQDHPHPPPVVLTAFEVYDQVMERAPRLLHLEELELGHNQSFFTLRFAALSFIRPDRNRYSYQLAGLDDGWIDAGERNFATYTHVAPGSYLFRVRGSNGDGVWNDAPATLRVVIKPPMWNTWWARAFYATAFSALILTYVVTQRRQLAHRSAQLAERERLITELEAKNTELERFNYTISHDLRNPLVTITNFLGLVRRGLARGDLQRVENDLTQIELAAGKMSRLLEELLELCRIGRVINPPESVPFGEIVDDAAALLEGVLSQRGVELAVEPDLPVVRGDRARLTEVVQNLIENAVKFSDVPAAPRVEVGARRDDRQAIFYVRDFGIGIEPQYHERIFDLFERLDARIEGTGVGLALVQRIVETHGGRIWVESRGRGHGSTFYFTLPLEA